ncbi:6-bladed beta-propeller [Echinicola vietnamensis]|uniref:6-bladed beta-propeller n=1 Tax=Echinicola vietnamensis (strain DSM 17526 / LMG 23754 / KMM 6221) TaxID=926556 RepID=L0FYD6_ECHVK|nr:6-bladed beta-propeller [Echinicola vietnamensis]AGA78033.1 hypothetical protein Echvi_1768 [Echinicola vietnamensis DSM 17526]
MIFTQHFPFLATLMAFFIFSCTKKQAKTEEDGLQNIVINTNEVKDTVDISNRIKNVTISRLEETEGNHLGMVGKILIGPDHYIVIDRHETNQAFLYDKKGNFIKNLIPLGNGPLEINQLNDCWINHTGTLEVYDYSLKKVVVYNEQFEPDSTFKTSPSIIFSNISPLKNGGYLAYNEYSGYNGPFEGKNYKVGFLNGKFNLQAIALPYPEGLNEALITSPLNPFWKVKDSIRFYQNYNPYIYDVLPNQQLAKRFKLDYQPNPLPDNYEEEIFLPNVKLISDISIPFQDKAKVYEGYAGFSGAWNESQDIIMFSSFDEKHKRFISLYDKRKKESIVSAHSLVETERFKIALLPYLAFDAGKKAFIGVLQGWILEEYLLLEGSPFKPQIGTDKESNFLIEVVFK